MNLSQTAFERAMRFIKNNGRPLELARANFHFGSGSPTAIMDALRSFQNDDGGFGRAIEPDLRTPQSSALGTTVALQVMHEACSNTINNAEMKREALGYLMRTYNEKVRSWRIIPPEAESSPRAPWWYQAGREAAFDAFSVNPTAEILGYLYAAQDAGAALDEQLHALPVVISQVTERVMSYLLTLEEIEMHDLLCCLRLINSAGVPQEIREQLIAKLRDLTVHTIATNPADWEGYSLRPLQVIDRPDSPFMPGFEEAVAANLDYEIASQNESGAWMPTWSWDDTYPEAWHVAKNEWAAVLTLSNLLLLNRFNRIRGEISRIDWFMASTSSATAASEGYVCRSPSPIRGQPRFNK